MRDIGVYTYGSVRFVTGAEPVELHAKLKRENGVDTWAHVTGEMAGPRWPLYLFRHDLDAAFPAPGGGVSG